MTSRAERNPSLWIETDPPEQRYQPLQGDQQADVVVIGAGIAGLVTAHELQQRGADVVVLERDLVGTGVTGYTTGKVTSLHGLIYADLEERHSPDVARIYGEANEFGVAAVRRIAKGLSIACDLEDLPAFTYAQSDATVPRIEAEVEAARRAGLPASFTTDTGLPYDVRAAIRFDKQLHFHPRRFLDGLAAAIARSGRVHEATEANDVDESDGACVVETDNGTIRAQHVVVATQLPFIQRGLFYAKASPNRSYAMAGRFDDPPRGMYLTADDPARTVRPHFSSEGNWLIVGGEYHKVGQQDVDPTEYYERIEAFGREAFDLDVEVRWSAQDYMPADDIPYIGRASGGTDRIFVATGFKKWGLSAGAFGATLIADLIDGRDNPWADVFDATRIDPSRAGKKLVKENINVAKRFVGDRVSDAMGRSVEELAPGEGDVVRIGAKTAAVFRDEGGDVHVLSPDCTHMGCHVTFNTAERSWDCPCHGSRFSIDGTVLEGPATEPLARLEGDVSESA